MTNKHYTLYFLFIIVFLCIIITHPILAETQQKYVSFTYSENQQDDNFLKTNYTLKSDLVNDFNNTTKTTIKKASTKKVEEKKEKESQEKKQVNTQNKTSKSNSVTNVSETELNILAKIINAEAKGEPYSGKVAVGAVIMNRIKSSKYPNDIKSVVFAKNQFTPVSNGSYQAAVPTEDDYRAANAALSGEDPTNGALTFYAYKYTKSSYHESLTHTATIGGHKFFK